MDNFKVFNPTTLYFGSNVIDNLSQCLGKTGKRVLLIYGKGSVKANGVYSKVAAQVELAGGEIFEYAGVKSNPVYQDVDAAARIAQENNIDVVVAMGGGSVIDTAKMVALTACVSHSSWDFFTKKTKPRKALPLICVLTLAATGTEMNSYAVIQNDTTKQKLSYGHPLIFPKYSFLDPAYTISVPYDYTAYGIVDIMAHALEAYFGKGESRLTDNITLEIVKETMYKGQLLLNNLQSYDLRADIMLAATLALNGTTVYGKSYGDWGVHAIGHVLSSLYDIPHGASLSIAYPAWLKLHREKIKNKIEYLGEKLFDEKITASETIKKMEDFLIKLKTPLKVTDIFVEAKREDIKRALVSNEVSGYYHKLSADDYDFLLEQMMD